MNKERKAQIFDMVDGFLQVCIVISFIVAWGLGLFLIAVQL